MTKEQEVKKGDWVILTDPINNGQIVTDIHNNGYIVFDGGITSSYKVFNGEFISIPKYEYERLKELERQKKINEEIAESSRQIQRETLLYGLELLNRRKKHKTNGF